MLYRVALGTGFRVSELAALTPEWFDFEADPPTASQPATETKNERPVAQPLAEDLATALATFLRGRPLVSLSGRGRGPSDPPICSRPISPRPELLP